MKRKLIVLAVIVMFVLTECAKKDDGTGGSGDASAKYKSGTYTATTAGHNGDSLIKRR